MMTKCVFLASVIALFCLHSSLGDGGRLRQTRKRSQSLAASAAIPECTAKELSTVKGFLLDLDGTMYGPEGLLNGTVQYFDWLAASKTPYVLLSNGFKTREGVAAKFASQKFKINQVIDPKDVYTAGVSLARYMEQHAPQGSKIFAIGTSITYGDGSKDFLTRILKREVPKELFDTWDVRTDLNMTEIYQWATLAKKEKNEVFVVLATMSDAHDKFGDDPVTGRSGYKTVDYELMKKVNGLLRNGGHLVVGAPDVVHSMPPNPDFPLIDTAWPTTGGFESQFLSSAELFPGTPREAKYHANTGKGGNMGAKYMVEPAIKLLEAKVPKIQRKDIMIIGDNFGTDILAGNAAGIRSMLVLVGAHKVADAVNWTSRPTCYLEHVGKIVELLSTEKTLSTKFIGQKSPVLSAA